ncbi:MAG: efflux RND transporter periplasmic adaptor subunit [Tepidisphaeraceae bacterium]
MKALRYMALVVVLSGVGLGGYLFGRHASTGVAANATESATTEPAAEEAPVPVRTALVRQGSLRRKVIAYGPVIADPAAVAVMSVPFESRVIGVIANPGQVVEAGAILGQVSPSPDTQLQVRQAQAAVLSANKDLEQTQQRFGDHLATNTELLTSQQNADLAKLKLNAFSSSGADQRDAPLRAPITGIVSKVNVQAGQVVPGGTSLVEVAPADRLIARLGVEPSDVLGLTVGDPVTLTGISAGAAESVAGTVSLVSQRVDADSRLVDVSVKLPADAKLAMGSYVRAEIDGKSFDGLNIPRAALVPVAKGFSVFVVRDGKATAHAVTIHLKQDENVQVSGDDVMAGDAVVVDGNLELDDGSVVTAAAAENSSLLTTEPTTEPATTPAAEAKP